MVNECLRLFMRCRAIILATLILLTPLSVSSAKETVTTQNMEVSGNYTLDGNLTIGNGTVLTLKSGTVLDTKNYSLTIDGTIIADNATIMSSIQTTSPGSHNAGVWDSLTISQGGLAALDNVTISNAKSCIINDGNLTAKSLVMEDCLIGLEIAGHSEINGLEISHVDNDGIRVSGTADITDLILHDMSAGISSSGNLSVSNATFTSTGTGVNLHGGTASIVDLDFISGVSNAVSISSGASGSISGMSGASNNAIVSLDSTGFEFSDIDMTGERLVNSWSAGDLTVTNATYFANTAETPIDIRTSGTVSLDLIELTGAFSALQVSHDAPWIGAAFSGSGDFILSNTSIEATDVALTASGTGTLELVNSSFVSKRLGLSFSGISSTKLVDVNVSIEQGGDKGIDILQGTHQFDNLTVNMPFNRFETGSVGVESWWCEIIGTSISVNGFADGLKIYESHLQIEDLSLFDSSQTSIYSSSSEIHVSDMLKTRLSNTGFAMVSSHAVIRAWSATYHENAANIDSQSLLNVWSLTSSSHTDSDMVGEGVVNYGTSQNLDIQVSESNLLWEADISFEDLSGNPVDADWQVLGFKGKASSGMATLPVSETGSTITATYSGVGAIFETVGIEGASHTIQVPIMPQGDWILTPGTVVVLGPTEDDSPHTAFGNITVPANAGLILQDTTLSIPNYAKIIVDEFGDLEGMNAIIKGEVQSNSNGFANSINSNLTIDGNVTWSSCQDQLLLNNLRINGNVVLDNSCRVTINSGTVEESVAIGNGAVFEIVNTLEILVTDKGEPVSGASISVQGQSVVTDSNGSAKKTAVALRVDSSGETAAGLQQVTMQWQGITDLLGWDTASSLSHEFVVSTVDGGVLSEWLVLEKAWSPYHLTSDLVIPAEQTMTINDGVSLRVADSVSITVEGTFNSGSSTISSMGSGSRWSGLIIGGNVETTARILGTNLFEGSPLLTIDGQASVLIGNSTISRSSSAEPLMRLTNTASGSADVVSTTFTDSSSHCIEAQGSAILSLVDVGLQNCNSNSLWARGSTLEIDGLVTQQAVDLGGTNGFLTNFNGGILTVNNLDGFEISDIEIESLDGIDNRNLMISGGIINGAPAITLENTAGDLTDLVIDCGGVGTGLISNHGRSTASLTISQSSINNCVKGIDLHSDGETAPMRLFNSEVIAETTISSDGYNVVSFGGFYNGSLDVSSSVVDMYDSIPTSYSVYQGEIRIWATHVFEITQNGELTNANLQLSVDNYWSQSFDGEQIQVSMPAKIYSDSGIQEFVNVDVEVSSVGNPTTNYNLEFGLDKEEVIQIVLVANQAPQARIIIPDDGFSIMESLPMEVRASVSDDLDDIETLDIDWTVTDGQTQVMQLSGHWTNITDLSSGTYVLNLEVTDSQGLTSTDTLLFEVTLLDSDGDWGLTCSVDSWYDKEENKYCGPDIHDTDDDNDGVLDIRDPWPTDACASMDTDSDGQPDQLHCPIGMTTWLNEDQDDDGDGTPDVLEGSNSEDDSEGNPFTVALFVVLFIAAFAVLFIRRNKGVD